MECIQNEKSLNTSINKLNWRFNYMFSDQKPGLLLYDISEAVKNNSNVIKTLRDWLELCYFEIFMIKKFKSKINHDIKAARELQLF